MDLYERVTYDGCFYVDSFVYNPDNGLVIVDFLGNPDLPDIVRVLEFTNVRDYTENRQKDWSENMIQSVIGIDIDDKYPDASGIRYEITMDEVIVKLTTADAPVIINLQ